MLRRLDVRIPLVLSLILATLVAVFGWRLSRRQGEAHLQSVIQTAEILAQAHANDAGHFLLISEYAGLEQHLLECVRMPGIRALQVLEPDGRVICHVQRQTETGTGQVLAPPRDRGWIPPRNRQLIERDRDRMTLWTPIVAGGLLGWLRTEYTLDSVREMQRVLWWGTGILGALLVTAGILMMIWTLRPPLRAIRDLAYFARNLNRRKGDQVAVQPVSFEIDELGAALNYASTELLSAERDLIAERERLAVTIGSIGDGVMSCDREGRITLMNRVAEALTGWKASEALGRPFEEVFRAVDRESGVPISTPVSKVLEAGEVVDLVGQAALVARNGLRRPIADSGAPIVSSQGEVLGVVVVFRDESAQVVEEEKRRILEEQLRQSQKMEAVGQMAGGIAHDFNNILTAIIGYTSLMQSRLGEEDPSRNLADRILRAADRAAGLTRSLLTFSRRQKVEMRAVDLNQIIRGQEHLLRSLLSEDILLRTDLVGEPLVAQVDAGQVEQVLLNLVTNARDAMPHGGLLGVSTQRIEGGGAFAEAGSEAMPAGPCALISVSDSGAGMDAATLKRIFEPFFTTKEVGKGTGLGLSIVHGIVQQHGGAIRVYSHPGIGTTFKIYLPLVATGEARTAPGPERTAPRGTERILLVEDEVEVRSVLRLMLEGGGYQVLEAADGAEALDLLKIHGSVALVVSDVIMPGMSGKELHDRLVGGHPGLKILYVSGYTPDVVHFKGFLDGDADLLMKPFHAQTILTRVREALDRS
jgi:PAS domain S-box-containing protein